MARAAKIQNRSLVQAIEALHNSSTSPVLLNNQIKSLKESLNQLDYGFIYHIHLKLEYQLVVNTSM